MSNARSTNEKIGLIGNKAETAHNKIKTEQPHCLQVTRQAKSNCNAFFGKNLIKAKETISHLKPRLPTASETLIAASSSVAIVDALADGVVDFSQTLTTVSAFNLVEINPITLRQPLILLGLASIPFLTSLGFAALLIRENNELIHSGMKKYHDSHLSISAFIKQQLKMGARFAARKPIDCLVLTTYGLGESTIFISNAGYVVNQFGGSLLNSWLLYPVAGAAFLVTLQTMTVNGPHLLHFMRHGMNVPDYTRNIHNRMLRFAAVGIVHVPPITSAMIAGMLCTSEFYELLNHVLKRAGEEGDIADKMAFIAVFLGIIFALGRYVMYGKYFAAINAIKMCHLVEEGFIKFVANNFIPKPDKLVRKLFLYPGSLLIALASSIVGFGAFCEFFAMVLGKTNGESSKKAMSSATYATLFSTAMLTSGAEAFAVEARSMLELSGLGELEEVRYYSEATVHTEEPTSHYTISKTFVDLLRALGVALIKIGYDWSMPSSVPATEIRIQNNLMGALLLAVFSVALQAIIIGYKKLPSELPSDRNRVNADAHDAVEAQIPTVQTETLTRNAYVINLFILGMMVLSITSITQLVIRDALLRNAENEESRLTTAQITATTIGSLTSVYGFRALSYGKKMALRIANNCSALFHHSDTELTNHLQFPNNPNVDGYRPAN